MLPRTTLRSHFDTIRDLSFCANNQLLASVSEDCMMKVWDAKAIKQANLINNDDEGSNKILDNIVPSYTFRGHTGPLFSVTSNTSNSLDDTFLYSAGSEGVIRIWKMP